MWWHTFVDVENVEIDTLHMWKSGGGIVRFDVLSVTEKCLYCECFSKATFCEQKVLCTLQIFYGGGLFVNFSIFTK